MHKVTEEVFICEDAAVSWTLPLANFYEGLQDALSEVPEAYRANVMLKLQADPLEDFCEVSLSLCYDRPETFTEAMLRKRMEQKGQQMLAELQVKNMKEFMQDYPKTAKFFLESLSTNGEPST